MSKRPPWWLHPSFCVLLLGVPFLIFAYLIPDNTFVELYTTEKHVTLSFVAVGLILYASLILGTFVKFRSGFGAQEAELLLYCRSFVWPFFLVTIFGYVVWFGYAVFVAGGFVSVIGSFSEVLQGNPGASDYVKFELFQTLPGVTTLTQVGILYATVEALLWTRRASRRRVALFRFGTLILLSLVRSLLLSERLAIVEVVIPFAVVLLCDPSVGQKRRRFARYLPLWLAPAVFLLFAVGEYFRSWSYYRTVYSGSYLEFAVQRFLGYYTTAVNNAAVLYYYEPLHPLRHTLNSLFSFPLAGGAFSDGYTIVFGSEFSDERYQQLLRIYANPEFNNVPILGLLPNEYTVFLAPLAALVIGTVSASLYGSFAGGRLLGMLLYPSWFIGLLEISRVYYWTSGRYFPVLLFLVASLLLMKLFKARAPNYAGSADKVERRMALGPPKR